MDKLMLKRWLKASAVFILLARATSLYAQAIDAQSLLKQRLLQLQSFKANFSQEVVDSQHTRLQQATGTIALQYPNKLYWHLNEPNENLLIADGQTLWQLDPFIEQAVAINQSQAIQNNPLILLTDPNGKHWDDFVVTEKDNKFVITAKDLHGQVAQLVLQFSEAKLVAMQIVDGQLQTSSLTFSDIQQNSPLAASMFVFTLPEGYELDDQR
jgi:outer membrane lipoprotein carrier protein